MGGERGFRRLGVTGSELDDVPTAQLVDAILVRKIGRRPVADVILGRAVLIQRPPNNLFDPPLVKIDAGSKTGQTNRPG